MCATEDVMIVGISVVECEDGDVSMSNQFAYDIEVALVRVDDLTDFIYIQKSTDRHASSGYDVGDFKCSR